MRIDRNTVATFDYAVRDGNGDLIDTSLEFGPLSYVHGRGRLVPGLEAALEGKSPGDKFLVKVPPSNGYGERDESLVQVLPRHELKGMCQLKVGMRLEAEYGRGKRHFTVAGIESDWVMLDENHPFSGKTVSFNITVLSVREATGNELRFGEANDAPQIAHLLARLPRPAPKTHRT